MHGFLGIHELPETFSLLLTYLTIIVIINSFNLIDGIDGLAGSLGLMSATVFGCYFLMVDMPAFSILSFSLAGTLVAFLIFNFQPAKVFMGDTGSLLIGLIQAILVIKFINVADSAEVAYPMVASPAIGFAILMVPLMDTLRVFAIRIFHRRSPFSPDRNHVHHLLLDKGLSHKEITLTLVTINIAVIIAAYMTRNLGVTWVILAIASLFFTGIAALYYTRPRSGLVMAKTSDSNEPVATSKIVPLAKDILEHKN